MHTIRVVPKLQCTPSEWCQSFNAHHQSGTKASIHTIRVVPKLQYTPLQWWQSFNAHHCSDAKALMHTIRVVLKLQRTPSVQSSTYGYHSNVFHSCHHGSTQFRLSLYRTPWCDKPPSCPFPLLVLSESMPYRRGLSVQAQPYFCTIWTVCI